MVVESKKDESGQSLLEFLLMLPMLIGLVVVLVRVNTVIQVSIVNQQYARMHALFLNYNSAQYPELRFVVGQLLRKKDNQMVIGVSQNVEPEDPEEAYSPEAATYYIARVKNAKEDAEGKTGRANVRVRDTVTICTQNLLVQGQSGLVPALPLDEKLAATGPYNLSESPGQFRFCTSNLKYVIDPEEGET